ncbi:hypothetical protein KO489_13980 [Reinekea forsetii]|nr:hypothetical protein [Reinekea forsetii]
MGVLIFTGLSAKNPLGILLFAYLIGFLPALIGCAASWAVYAALNKRYYVQNYIIGLISGMACFLLLVVWRGVPNDANSILAIFLMFIVPSSVCSALSIPHAEIQSEKK